MAKTYNQIKKSVLGKSYDINKSSNKTEKTYNEIKSGVKEGKYNFNRVKQALEKEIRFDTFTSDISSLAKTIDDTQNGWQPHETMSNTRSSIESMQNRLGAYKEYQKLFGGADLSELQSAYKSVLDGWDDLSKNYGRYKNADAYKAENTRLKELGNMNSSDVKNEMKGITDLEDVLKTAKEYEYNVNSLHVKKNTWEHRGRGLNTDGGYSDKLKSSETELNKYLKSVGYSSVKDIEKALSGKNIAYTTVGGENITWQSLYDQKKQAEESEKQYKEISSMDDFAKYRDKGANIENPSYEEGEKTLTNWFPKDIGNIVEYANDNKGMIGLSNAYASFGDDRVLYTLMTDKEREIHNYHLGRELEGLAEKGTAEKYLKSIEGILKDRHENQEISRLIDYTDEHPVLGSAISVWANLGAGG